MAKKKKKARLAKIRSLDFLRSIRLTEADTRTLLEMHHEVNAHPEQYDSLISAWQRFVDAQELIAGQLKYRDWKQIDAKTLVSLAKGHFDLQGAVKNFLPGSLWVPDDDRCGWFMWHLLLKAFMQDDAELLRECSVCWQAIPFVVAEVVRRANEPKNKAGFLRALHLYFSESEDRDMHGADLMRDATVKELAKLAWRRLPARVKSELYLGQTRRGGTQEHASVSVLAHTYKALARDRNVDPMRGLERWLDGVFNELPVGREIGAEKPVEDALDRRLAGLDVESLKAGAADLQTGTNFTRDYERKLVKQFCAVYPGDKALLYALYEIEDQPSLEQLARRKGKSLKTIKRRVKKAETRFREWMKANSKSKN